MRSRLAELRQGLDPPSNTLQLKPNPLCRHYCHPGTKAHTDTAQDRRHLQQADPMRYSIERALISGIKGFDGASERPPGAHPRRPGALGDPPGGRIAAQSARS